VAYTRLGEYEETSKVTPEPVRSVDPALHAGVSAVLRGAHHIVTQFESSDRPSLGQQIETCQEALLSTQDPAAIAEAATRGGELILQAAAFVAAQRSAERQETASLIEAIQGAVAALSGETEAFHASLKQSTDRFDRIAGINHIIELKTRLMAEVSVLKVKTAEGQRAWQSSVEALGRRIASLELQLHTSRQEGALDPLTGAANRGAFDKRCQEWLKSGLLQFSILLIDVDDFKKVNDTFGHPEGDRVLVAVAEALQTTVRSSQDMVARIGGDEFAVLALDLPLRGAEGLFARFVAALNKASKAENPPVPAVSLSGGVAEFSAGDTVKSLVQRADDALYEAKRHGKNRVVVKDKPLMRDL
jgi:diguanylate cyclase